MRFWTWLGNMCPACYHHTHGTTLRTYRCKEAVDCCKNWPTCEQWDPGMVTKRVVDLFCWFPYDQQACSVWLLLSSSRHSFVQSCKACPACGRFLHSSICKDGSSILRSGRIEGARSAPRDSSIYIYIYQECHVPCRAVPFFFVPCHVSTCRALKVRAVP